MRPFLPILFLVCALGTNGLSFLDAISSYPQLSNFTSFYSANQALASLLITNSSNYPITVLVPNDHAFAIYEEEFGVEITALSPAQLAPLVQYHTLVGGLNKDNFTDPRGLTVPTLLVGEQYNNRSVGSQLAAEFGGSGRSAGQVVFISGPESSSTKLRIRQAGSGGSNPVRSGLSSTVNLTVLDGGTWDGGNIHMIDGLLTIPEPCSKTIRASQLTSLDNALNRTNIWPALDHSPNVTCLGPSNQAFADANNADSTLNETALTKALLFHTLPQTLYSNFLVDGQEFTTLSNDTIRVMIKGNDIYFNNAKVINPNVLTNNGLMHVLDSVMMPLNQPNATSAASPTASQTASSTSSHTPAAAKSSSAAMVNTISSHNQVTMGILSILILFF